MDSIIFGDEPNTCTTAILIKESAFKVPMLEMHYVSPLEALGVPKSSLCALPLYYNPETNKVKAAEAKAYIKVLLEKLKDTGIKTLVIADSTYFKYFAKVQKLDKARGYTHKCPWIGYEDITLIFSLNYNAVQHNENAERDIKMSLQLTADTVLGQSGGVLGDSVIKYAIYPNTVDEIAKWLTKLLLKPKLTMDIETFSLRFEKAGIGTVAFAWSSTEGIAFDVSHTNKQDTDKVKALLKSFLINYKGQLIFHNLLFDDKVLIYTLFMEHDSDWEGMQQGLDIASTHDDSMVALYLATNSAVGNKLSLKEAAYGYLGAYGEDNIEDISQIPLDELLLYNLKDTLATFYVWDKYYPRVIQDNQLDFYQSMAKPSLKIALRMMLTGLPLDMEKVKEAKHKISKVTDIHENYLKHSKYVKQAEYIINYNEWVKANAKLKKKVRLMSEFKEKLNPNSDIQLRVLLYEVMKLPIVNTTDSGQASTSAKTINRLIQGVKLNTAQKRVLEALIGISNASTSLTTFIPAFEEYAFTRKTPDELNNTVWLNGDLKTTGTVSGRLSSSNPNCQNIPSGSEYGKLIKSCFVAPEGWLFVSADFSSLEDRINAILTNDPNKVKVYTEGYDGHCIRAHSYYKDQMPDIDPTSVESINSIADRYSKLRSRSKNPTFALTYMGTSLTLVNNLGFTKEEALTIETNYHKLYEVSDLWSEHSIQKAAAQGYLDVAFGLKVRTPRLASAKNRNRFTSAESAEGRTVNNAAGQSYGLLMNRAIIDFMGRVEASGLINSILCMNTIHDAVYLLVRREASLVEWVNENLIDAMSWNDLETIKHKDIGMEAELDVGVDWANPITLKNNASLNDIQEVLDSL